MSSYLKLASDVKTGLHHGHLKHHGLRDQVFNWIAVFLNYSDGY